MSTAREILEHAGEHPVVSLFVDLDPSQFATAPARASQVRSLLDEAERDGRLSRDEFSHADRSALTQDLERLQDYLGSDEPPVSGARALAVYCSSQDDLFEAVPLRAAIPPKVVIAPTPYIEPLVTAPDEGRTAVVLISRRTGRILVGATGEFSQTEKIADNVHGQHARGGLSQLNYERSIDADVQHHMRHVAGELYHGWQREPFTRLILGGPALDVEQFAGELHNDLRRVLVDDRLDVDAESASPADVRAALEPVLARAQASAEQAALVELEERLGAGARASRGAEATLKALNERRVETLLLAHNFSAQGIRCPSCGLFYPQGTTTCPSDGEQTTPVPDLREAVVEAAVLQDASVLVIGEGSDPPPAALQRGQGIAALLRF